MTKGVTPDQEFIKIMYDELVAVMGAEQAELAQVNGWGGKHRYSGCVSVIYMAWW